jgi:hypothetical protein
MWQSALRDNVFLVLDVGVGHMVNDENKTHGF